MKVTGAVSPSTLSKLKAGGGALPMNMGTVEKRLETMVVLIDPRSGHISVCDTPVLS